MTLYGMWDGGVMGCCGVRKDGKRCGNRGYALDRGYGYWCPHHKDQEKRS